MKQLLWVWSSHEAELRRWLSSRAPVKSEVDDLLQEVFLKVMKQRDHLPDIRQPRAWLFEIARNTLTDRLRRSHEALHVETDLDAIPSATEPGDTVDSLAQACLPRVLAELDPQDREVIELCDLQGMTQSDYAHFRQLSLPATKSRLQRARRRMREHMVLACRVSLDASGRVDDFVPRQPPIDACGPTPNLPTHAKDSS